MIGRLVIRHLRLHPVRSLVFLGSYAAGVAVMLALLSIGEVMLSQARQEKWIGGGDITVVPTGVDLETLRLGGAVFYHLESARFLAREVLGGPRLGDRVGAVAPWIDDRVLYLRAAGRDSSVPVRANGQIPSAARALGAAPDLLAGSWSDTEADRRWLSPTPFELYSEIDRFHRPSATARLDTTWAEWHYFNLLWPDARSWLYLSYIVFGDVAAGRGGGIVLARYRGSDGRDRSYVDSIPAEAITYSLEGPDLVMGAHDVRLLARPPRYRVRARLPADRGDERLVADLVIAPRAHRYFPPTELASSDSLVSGYVAPALRAGASGSVCIGGACADAEPAIAYHDHNWGTWSGVTWDWGVAHAGPFDVLYGGIEREADASIPAGPPFLAYVVDSLGVAAALGLEELDYQDGGTRVVAGDTLRVPGRLDWVARGRTDTLTARIELRHVSLSRAGPGEEIRAYFAQMQGRMRIRGRLGGRGIEAEGPGFFETYLRPDWQPAGAVVP